jgi:short-chain fatty acids transporter
MIQNLGRFMSRTAGRAMPDPFVLAVLLTVLTLIASVLFGREVADMAVGPRLHKVVVEGWFGGLFGGALKFAFQMAFVLVTGFAVAHSRPVRAVIDSVAGLPRDAAQASAVVAFVACLAGYVHWGLGAVAGAMLAREIGRAWAKMERPLHYPLLGAAAYSGLLVWHGGLSGSAPLKAAETKGFLAEMTGAVPVEQTLFSGMNFAIVLSLMAVSVALYYFLTPKSPDRALWFQGDTQESTDDAGPQLGDGPRQFAIVRFLDDSVFIPLVVCWLAGGYLLWAGATKGLDALNLNTVNLAFLAGGLLLHGSPRAYVAAAAKGAKASVGILLQFPLYFGILGMLTASGLVAQLSEGVVSVASETTLPILTFLSAGLVNLFVPSGGGQWAVQGPVMMKAAAALGADSGKVIVALSHGDAWTNMLQPFWALPLLGIMGLRARDIVGYTTLLCLLTGPVVIFWLLVW